MSAKEKRAYERTSVCLEVLLRLDGHDPIFCRSRDFSANGAFLEFVEDLKSKIVIGEKGNISATHQSTGSMEIISANISVVRIALNGIGISLLSEENYRRDAA